MGCMKHGQECVVGDMIDYDQALLDPGSVFSQPEDILIHSALSREQKIEILRRWTYDASEVCVATEEGMPNGNGDLLQRIHLALEQLADIDPDRSGPTKQRGIPRSAVKPK
jgi:hypothetical protein